MRSARSHNAFTLIEAIAAIILLSIATPAMFWVIRDAQTRRADPSSLVTARWLATERLETIIADRHNPERGYAYVLQGNYPNESLVAGFNGFTRSVSVSETGPDLAGVGAGYKQVRVRVGYSVRPGQTSSFELATVITDY